MILYYRTEKNRICAAGFSNFAPDLRTIDVPDGFDLDQATDYKVVDGSMIYDPVPPDPVPVDPVTEIMDRLEILDGAITELASILGGD